MVGTTARPSAWTRELTELDPRFSGTATNSSPTRPTWQRKYSRVPVFEGTLRRT